MISFLFELGIGRLIHVGISLQICTAALYDTFPHLVSSPGTALQLTGGLISETALKRANKD